MDYASLILALICLVAAAWDIAARRVPNFVTLPALALAFFFVPWREAFLGAGLALLIGLPLFALRALGGGDVKLMAAIGAWCGPTQFGLIFVVNALLGGVAALVLAGTRGALRVTLRRTASILGQLLSLRAPAERLDSPSALTLPRAAILAVAVLLVRAFGSS